ncbi:hypothetical protein VE23_17345 [Paenibacillus sp. D9]|uniref:hypothetical protein n=1 Tax=Paenibacillus sp. D9 TaxID=665792 RepID=UPI00061E3135|nr:hypothetical protein [Paenibacillus sp. D9]KKC48452.1 hypothetical protein VE23_17345 [Paenibacillus sp. D9]
MNAKNRPWKQTLAVLSAAALVAAAGCSKSPSPKAELESALASIAAASSYAFHSTVNFDDLQLPSGQAAGAATGEAASLLKGMNITMDGVYQKDPMRTDANVQLALPGNPQMNLTLPIIMTGSKLYVKVPSIPALPATAQLADKYVVIDTDKLAEEQGEQAAALDPAVQQKLMLEAGAAFIKPFEEKTYFKSLKAKDVQGLPEGLEPDSVSQFLIDSSNAEDAKATAAQKAIPAVLDVVLGNEQYLKALGMDKAEAEDSKKQLQDPQSELSKKLKEQLKLSEVKVLGAVKDGKMAYESVDANIEYAGGKSGPLKLVMHFTTSYSKVGEKAAFTGAIPTDAIPVEQLEAALQGSAASK